VADKEYVDWISLSQMYNYVVRVIKSCSPGFLNCVLQASTFRAKTEKKHHKQGQQRREKFHLESDSTGMRLDHTASFQTSFASQMTLDLLFGLKKVKRRCSLKSGTEMFSIIITMS